MLGNRINYARQAFGGQQGAQGIPGVAAQQGQAGPSSVSSVPTFNQAGYQKANARYIAGSFIAGQHNPFDIGPKGADIGPNPLFSKGALTTTAPNVADYQGTKTIMAAQSGLQRLAGGTQLHAHPAITSLAANKLPKASPSSMEACRGVDRSGARVRAEAWLAGFGDERLQTLAQQTQIYTQVSVLPRSLARRTMR